MKRAVHGDGPRYVLRETYRDSGKWKYRSLADLGPDPSRFIVYSGGPAFRFKKELRDILDATGSKYSLQELEEAFMPILDPFIRRDYERAGGRPFPYNFSRACSWDDLPAYQEELHAFDVRRLHFLSFGHIHMARVESSRSYRFLKVLSCKCRDEIEAVFDAFEADLPRREVVSYLYTALHLHEHFPRHKPKNNPMGLDRDEVDALFLEEICRLNEDGRFFNGVDGTGGEWLHPYLAKYVWLYFDHEFEKEGPWKWFVRPGSFFEEKRYRRPVPGDSTMGTREACQVFGITREELAAMNRKDLIRIYRRRAKKAHPDRGGDHDAFVRLGEAYERLSWVKEA